MQGTLAACLIITECIFAEKECFLDQNLKQGQHALQFEGEYLLWGIKRNLLTIPLLTTASYSDLLPGAISQPGTKVLLGKDHFNMGWMNGFQVRAGAHINQHFEIEGSYFLLPTVSRKRSFNTSGEPGAPNFAVPIFDVTGVCGLNGIPGETIFILPGPLSGDPGFSGVFDFCIATRLQGAAFNGLYHIFEKDQFHLYGLGGFRWFQLNESLIFKAKTHTVANVSFPAGFFNFSDRFYTANNFLAAELGINGQYLRKKWKLEGKLKGAIGEMLEQTKIKGSSSTSGGNLFFETQGTANETLPGGVFAEPTNSGKHKRNRFAYAFEAHLGGGYAFTRHLKIDLGYTFLWLSNILRPGKQIDRKINTTLTALADASRSTVGTGPGPIPFGDSGGAPSPRGPKRPHLLFKTRSFYAQGFDLGVSLEF